MELAKSASQKKKKGEDLMRKRLLSTILALCLALTFLPLPARATVVDSGTCGDNLTWTLDDSGTLTISGTGEMANYTGTDTPWYNYGEDVKTVKITDGVTSIESLVFQNFYNLTSIDIPDSVTSIGMGAFIRCSSLTNINIPNSVTSIEWSTFEGCSSLTSVTIPDSVTSIETSAFRGCSSLTSVTIPDSVTSIEIFAFDGCNSLTSINIPNSVTSIGEGALQRCSSLTSINIPNSVTSIGDFAFNFSGLTSVTIPDSVVEIGYGPFAQSRKLERIEVNIDNPVYIGIEGVLFDSEKTRLIQYPAGKSIINYDIPDFVTSIEEYAFSGCSSLTSVTIPDSVTSIGQGAFDVCSSLTSVTIPDSVTSIGNTAFYQCNALKDVYYSGTEAQWNAVTVGTDNELLTNATIHYNSTGPILPTKLPSGVKYVPYTAEAAPGNYSGDPLPSGLTHDPNTGVISGVPMAAATSTFTITPADGAAKTFSLQILDNTDSNVNESNDDNDIKIETPLGGDERVITEYADQYFDIDIPYEDFVAGTHRVYIDGILQSAGSSYTALRSPSGGTRLVILEQTVEKMPNGPHTLAVEFKKGDQPNNPFKTVAQNFRVNVQPKTPSVPNAPSNPGSSSASSGTSSPALRPLPSRNPVSTTPATPSQTPVTPQGLPFTDVKEGDWFYDDVKWNYDEKLMLGISDTLFAPQREISQATIVTVLARLAKADLSQFEGAFEDNITPGQQYTTAAIWAKRSGLLPEGGTFTGSETTTRDQMAVMLVKYLRSMGKDTTPPSQCVEFADAEGMSQEGNDAFQVLYSTGVFKGVGGLRMNPTGSTTRAHFAALIHRIANLE